MYVHLLRASGALSLLFPHAALAEDAIELDEIIISGGFTPIEEAEYGRSATVITAQEIEDRGITTVQDALRAVPGVSVSGSGDSFTQVRIRGGEANHTLVLIDGIPAAGGNSEYIFSGLETANIERIEVLRGPQSVFYGSNASSGVINIITKRGGIGQEFGGSVEVGDATTVTGRYSVRNELGGVALSLSHTDDKGYDISGDGGEKDELSRSTLHFTGDYMLTEQFKFGLTFRQSEEDYDFDRSVWGAPTEAGYVVDDPSQFSERTERLGNIWGELETLSGRMRHRVSLDYSDYKSSSNGGAPTKADRKSARYLLSFGLDGRRLDSSNHILNAIAEYREDSSTTNPTYAPARASYALEYRGNFDSGLSLQGGLRYDDNKTFEDDVTWNISAAYMLASGIRLHASAGEGSVDPSYFELFANSWGYVGNPNLTPEKNRSFDLGAEIPFAQGRGLVDVTVFDETLTDEITSVFDPVSGNFNYINQSGDSTRRGAEIAGSFKANDTLDLRLSYTYLDAENPDGSVEWRRPRHELLLTATQAFMNDRGRVTADLRYVADNYDNQYFGSASVQQLPNYVTVDAAAQYAINDRLSLTGRVTNLFDKEYSDVWGYAKRGRAFYVGLKSTF